MEKEVINFGDIDAVMVIGFEHNREEAHKFLNEFEIKECGLSEEELTEIDLFEAVEVTKRMEDGEPFYYWGNQNKEGEKFKAFVIHY